MKLRVKDLITPPCYVLPLLTTEPREAPFDRLFCDTQWRATLRRMLDYLTPGSLSKAPVTLLAGEAHSGKSRLLRVARAVLRDPAGPVARKIFPDTLPLTAPSRTWLVVDLTDCVVKGTDPESLLRQSVMEAAQVQGVALPEAEEGGLASVLRALPKNMAVAVMIDDLDQVLSRQDEFTQRLLDFILELAQPSENSTLSLLLAVRLEAVEAEGDEGHQVQAKFRRLLRISELVLTDRASLVNLALERLLAKGSRQQREIAWLLRALKQQLPLLECNEQEFIRCYPLHPPALRLAQQLWLTLPESNLARFLLDSTRTVYERPAISLFAVDDLFELLQTPLRRDPRWQSLFEAHDQVLRAVQPFNSEWRLWARIVTRALVLYTAADLPVTSRELAESCLIYGVNAAHGAEKNHHETALDTAVSSSSTSTPDSSSSNSENYHWIELLLDQMRRLAPEYILSDGATEPRYTLARLHYRSIGEKLLAESKAIGDAAPQLFRLLCQCGGAYFEDWPLALTGRSDVSFEWRVEEMTNALRFVGTAADAPLRVLIGSWTLRGKVPQAQALDFVWRLAEPSSNELRVLKSLAVLHAWQEAGHANVDSPPFACLLADVREQAEQIFARLLLLDGHLSQNARPVPVDCEPPLSLHALLRRQPETSSVAAIR